MTSTESSAGGGGSMGKPVSPNAAATLSISAGLMIIDGKVDTPMGRSARAVFEEPPCPATIQSINMKKIKVYIKCLLSTCICPGAALSTGYINPNVIAQSPHSSSLWVFALSAVESYSPLHPSTHKSLGN